MKDLENVLEGTTAIAVSKEDYVAGAKILCGFADKSKDIFNVKAGFVDGNVVDAKGVKELAELPPKEVLGCKGFGRLECPYHRICHRVERNNEGPGCSAECYRREERRRGLSLWS